MSILIIFAIHLIISIRETHQFSFIFINGKRLYKGCARYPKFTAVVKLCQMRTCFAGARMIQTAFIIMPSFVGFGFCLLVNATSP